VTVLDVVVPMAGGMTAAAAAGASSLTTEGGALGFLVDQVPSLALAGVVTYFVTRYFLSQLREVRKELVEVRAQLESFRKAAETQAREDARRLADHSRWDGYLAAQAQDAGVVVPPMPPLRDAADDTPVKWWEQVSPAGGGEARTTWRTA
jgi:hypothetical protein